MTAGRPLACVLALLAAGACARRTEIIGRLIDAAAIDGIADGPATETSEVGGGDGPVFALCPPAAVPTPVLAPVWNCPGQCWRHDRVDPVPVGTGTRPGVALSPQILYPLAGSVHPRNLTRLTIHWRRAIVEQDAFRLRFQAATDTYELYVPYTEPVASPTPHDQLDSLFPIPDTIWRYIAQQHAGGEVTITVAAYDRLAQVVDESRPLSIRIARDAVEGGLYYMTTEESRGRGVQRHIFGTAEVQPLIRAGAPPMDCVGCHSASRFGARLAFASTYQGNLGLVSAAPPGEPLLAGTSTGLAPAISPDGMLVVARHRIDRSVAVYRADTGARISGQEASFFGGRIDFPVWSPTGRALAATRASLEGQPVDEHSARNGELVLIPFDGTNLGPPQPLLPAPDAAVNAYPAWSPDGEWIVFTSSPAGSETLRNQQTRLRIVHRTGSNLRELGNATSGAVAGSKFARFAPTGSDGCRSLFIVFQSGLDYGVIRRNAADWIQLWMSAIDLSNTTGDPSSPPVWLPFQDHLQKNLLPAWSETVPCPGCGTGARCDNSRTPARCVPN